MTKLLHLIAISICTFIVFGFIDSLFFGIFLNEGLSSIFIKIGINSNNSDIMVGSVSASTAILFAYYIKRYSKRMFGELIEHPFLDIVGVITGTFLYILVFRQYKKYKPLLLREL